MKLLSLPRSGHLWCLSSLLLFSLFLLNACAPGDSDDAATAEEDPAAADGDSVSAAEIPHVMLWVHAGPPEERNTIRNQIHRFNTTQNEIQLDVAFLPADEYDDIVRETARDGSLPDLLELEGPDLYRYVWEGHIQPLDDLLSEETRDDLLSPIIEQGTYEGKLYSVSVSDTALGLFVDPIHLLGIDTRIPRSPRTAWSVEEFDDLLAELHEKNGGEPVLDLKMNYDEGWAAYAFGPVLQSAGADLIDRESFQQADGVVNSDAAVRAMTWIQSWFEKGYIDPNEDDEAFTSGRVGLSWTGHWDFPRYEQALDSPIVLVPLPDFGEGSRTGHGGWSLSITRDAEDLEAAATVLEYFLHPEHITERITVSGAIPARRSIVGRTSHYGDAAAMQLLARHLEEGAATRPQTPAFATIETAFDTAFENIREGADVQTELDALARAIDQDIADNDGYQSGSGAPKR